MKQPDDMGNHIYQLDELNIAFIASNKEVYMRGNGDGIDAIFDKLYEVTGSMPLIETGAIQHVVLLAYHAQKKLLSNSLKDAEKLIRQALVMQPNHLFLQKQLRQATDTQYKHDLKERFCSVPFESIETQVNGDVYFCCPAWLPISIGNLNAGNANAIWNSPIAQEIRSSILDGSYRYCSRTHCPKLSRHTLPRSDALTNQRQYDISKTKRIKLDFSPKKIILSHDRSCNLSCPSCRTKRILARKKEQIRMNKMADDVIFPLLQNADRVRITASGDPFGSAHFQYILRNLDKAKNPKLRLDIQTNGVLLTEKLWDKLSLEGRVDNLMVSVDATQKETYDIVRRGGDFETLLENLSFMSSLRRDKRIQRFRLDFVVQSLNYQEMPGFVHLARQLNCDGVKFQMIRSWGTYSRSEFSQINISDPNHQSYAHFINVLCDLDLSSSYIELWGMGKALTDAEHKCNNQQ